LFKLKEWNSGRVKFFSGFSEIVVTFSKLTVMRNRFIYILILLSAISCAKETVTEKDTVKPEIKVIYPLDIPQLPQGYPLCLSLVVADNKSLYSVRMEVNDGSGFIKEYPLTGRMTGITEKYFAPPGASGSFSATFIAMDDAGNTSLKEIKFVLNN
jgi:hypothetical protein